MKSNSFSSECYDQTWVLWPVLRAELCGHKHLPSYSVISAVKRNSQVTSLCANLLWTTQAARMLAWVRRLWHTPHTDAAGALTHRWTSVLRIYKPTIAAKYMIGLHVHVDTLNYFVTSCRSWPFIMAIKIGATIWQLFHRDNLDFSYLCISFVIVFDVFVDNWVQINFQMTVSLVCCSFY